MTGGWLYREEGADAAVTTLRGSGLERDHCLSVPHLSNPSSLFIQPSVSPNYDIPVVASLIVVQKLLTDGMAGGPGGARPDTNGLR